MYIDDYEQEGGKNLCMRREFGQEYNMSAAFEQCSADVIAVRGIQHVLSRTQAQASEQFIDGSVPLTGDSVFANYILELNSLVYFIQVFIGYSFKSCDQKSIQSFYSDKIKESVSKWTLAKIFLYILLFRVILISGEHATQQNSSVPSTISSSENFTFAQNGSFLQLDAGKEWPFNSRREISFKFKTKSPHGLLIYQTFDHNKLTREDDQDNLEIIPPPPVVAEPSLSGPPVISTKPQIEPPGLVGRKINSPSGERISNPTTRFRKKRSGPVIHSVKQLSNDVSLADLPSKAITAAASEKLVNSLFSAAPAATINGNANLSPVRVPLASSKSQRESNLLMSSVGKLVSKDMSMTSKNHRLMNDLTHSSSDSARPLISYGGRRSLDTNEESAIFSSSAISSISGSLYELYLKLENGRLKIMYEFGSRLNQTYCGKGLNDDRWHKVDLKVDPELNQMILVLDQVITVEIILSQQQQEDENMRRNEFVFTNSVLYVGGLDNNSSIVKNIKQRLYMAQFIGCIGQILLRTDQNTETSLQPAAISRVVMVRKGCVNKCETENYCLHKSTCINFYTHTKCDCFGTNYEDVYCWQDQLTTLSMLGYSTLIHRIYDWRDRHHSSINRLSIQFRTFALDSILFFAYGDSNQNQKNPTVFGQSQTMAQLQMPLNISQVNLPVAHTVHRPPLQPIGSSNYIAMSLTNGTIFFEISFGDGQPILLSNMLYDKVYNRTARLPSESNPTSNFYRPLSLADGRWHNVTFIHSNKQLYLHVDNYSVNYTVVGKNYHLYLDPSIYLGAVPNLLLNETKVLTRPFNLRHKFVGCLRSVYFNHHDLLLSLKNGSPITEYRDSLGKARLNSCLVEDPSSLPLTIRSGKSYLTFQLSPNSQIAVPNPNLYRHEESQQMKNERSNASLDAKLTNEGASLKKLTKIQFDYKTSLKSYFLAGGHLRDLSYHDLGGFWTLHARNNCQLYFTISSGLTYEPEQVIEIDRDVASCDSKSWFRVSISMISGDKILNMTRTKVTTVNTFEDEYDSPSINTDEEYDKYKSYVLKASVELLHQVQIGGDLAKFGESSSVPFSGCIRRIKINGHLFDSRDFVTNLQPSSVMMTSSLLQRNSTDFLKTQSDVISSRIAQGYVTLDSCQLVTPCQYQSNPCENNGTCKINELGEPECDCSKTGYAGRRCHFSIYKQSCQELYLSGQRKSSHYLIDLDRNGPLKPIRVRCNMDLDVNRHIETDLSHNLPAEYLIRHSAAKDIKLDITYMAFHHLYSLDGFYLHDDNDESAKSNQDLMLRSLIGQSLYCKQYLKYECKSAPLLLGNRTWMVAPYPKSHRLTSLDGLNRGKCMCATTEKKCLDPEKNCNCDSAESFWTDDSYELIGHKDVGITQIVILKQDSIAPDTLNSDIESQSRLTLSGLRCYGTKLQESQHEITFKTSDAYIEVPGWRKGDISFSFRTASNPPAIILYQLASSRNHGYLRLTLISDTRLIFEFIVNRKPRKLFLSTSHKLNNGEWQQVFIEYDAVNLRLTVNDDSVLVDLDTNDYLGSFEGPLFVGGAPSKYLAGDQSKRNGFTGCFKGLVIADKSIDLRTYLSPSMPTVTSGCKPSCSKKLCQNEGKCIEYWGSYECECSNPIAHSGTNCEINLNTNSITFVTPESYYVQLSNDSHLYPSFLIKNILLNIRTYQETALILYASDHLNNFIQLHKNGSSLALTFNTNSTIITAQVPIEDEATPRVNMASLATNPLSQTLDTNINPILPPLSSNSTSAAGTNSSQPISRVNSTSNRSIQYFMEHSIRSSNTSGSGQPIQIKIERHRLRTTFFVNNNFMVIEKPIVFLANYTQNPWLNPEMELVRPPRPKIGSKTYSQIFLANIDEYFTTRLPGFAGCIQGLSIDGQLFDFNRAHLTGEIKGEYRIGCKMHCDSVPCKNQGTCVENWKEDRIECKCDLTSYVGRLCDEDIAAIFDGQSSYFQYHLSKRLSSRPVKRILESPPMANDNSTNTKAASNITEAMLNDAPTIATKSNIDDTTNFFELSLAFSTDSGQQTEPTTTTSLQVLVMISKANSSKHFFLGLTPDGSLLVQEDYGNSMCKFR